MPKRRHINADRGGSSLRNAATAVSEPVRALGWALEEKFVWRGADLAKKIAELARWPFERIAWLLERYLVWPVQERAAGRIPSPPGHVAGAGALAAVAVGITALGLISIVAGGNDRSGQVEALMRSASIADTSPAAEQPSGPVLHGAPPSFEVEGGGGGATAAGGSPNAAVSADATAVASAPDTTATTSSEKAVPAGPAAMRVARRFADAFLYYEIGEREKRAQAVFAETATPQLERALVERPPRQPESVQVPQARLLNVVPGPRHGSTYTISASLLRVGTTSELRLDMRKSKGNWVVTDVRG